MAYETTRSIAGTVAVITGATAGIGAATARQLVAAGGKVAIAGRRQERLDSLVAELGNDNAVAVAGDVSDPAHNDALVAAAVAQWGRIDTVVANAGVGSYGGILDIEDAALREMIDTNYLGTVWTVRSAVRQLRAQGGGGDVVIVSSVAGFRSDANEAVYAGTKHAQIGLANGLDRELRAEGIRVTAICPAGTATEFALGTGREEGATPFDDYLRPDDVAHAITTVLTQPRSVRTTIWQLWSMEQQA